jgi:hypothetical protein
LIFSPKIDFFSIGTLDTVARTASIVTRHWYPFHPILTSPLGANFDPQGWSCHPGGNFYP